MGLFQGLLLGHPAQGLVVLNCIVGVSTLDSPRDYRDSPPSVLTLQMLRHFSFFGFEPPFLLDQNHGF